jgi:hypothetical protein
LRQVIEISGLRQLLEKRLVVPRCTCNSFFLNRCCQGLIVYIVLSAYGEHRNIQELKSPSLSSTNRWEAKKHLFFTCIPCYLNVINRRLVWMKYFAISSMNGLHFAVYVTRNLLNQPFPCVLTVSICCRASVGSFVQRHTHKLRIGVSVSLSWLTCEIPQHVPYITSRLESARKLVDVLMLQYHTISPGINSFFKILLTLADHKLLNIFRGLKWGGSS